MLVRLAGLPRGPLACLLSDEIQDIDARDPNSGLHAYVSGTSPTVPSLQSNMCLFRALLSTCLNMLVYVLLLIVSVCSLLFEVSAMLKTSLSLSAHTVQSLPQFITV